MLKAHTEEFVGPGAWLGSDLTEDDESQFVYTLNSQEIEDIDLALQSVKDRKLDIPFSRTDFPLSSFKEYLDTIPEILEEGMGFVLIRGIPRDRYTEHDCELIYWGLSVYLGRPVSQNSRGHVLGHVRDEGKAEDDPNARLYQTTVEMDFHCDQLPTDVLGLFCVRQAKSGGESSLASVPAIHNIMRNERPDLLDALYQTYYLDWRDDHPEGEKPWYACPMLSFYDGKLTARITSRQYCETVTRFGEQFAMTDAQREALDYVQEVAYRPNVRFDLRLEDGDILFMNNHMLLHGRSEFVDHEEPELKRHLLRMWVAYPPERRRNFAPELAERVGLVDRGGIPQKLKKAS